MAENIFAYTAMTGVGYPPYVSFNRLESGDVEVTVRSAPTEYEGCYVCGFKGRDDNEPGRCVPGGPTCNNYCNMAPEKGPMQDHPERCHHVKEGTTVSSVVPAAEWERIFPNG